MLALLFASLLLTAIIVQNTYTPQKNLLQATQTLETNLHKKESIVGEFINNKANFDELKTLGFDEQAALKTIKLFTTDNSIWVNTYKGTELIFWTGPKVVPRFPNTIREGYSFIKEPNGYYETIKKSAGNFSVVFFIYIKSDYPVQNQYLQNAFAKNLFNDNNIDIADFADSNIHEVHASDGSYLFSVKLKPNEISHRFFYFEVTIWLLCGLVLFLLVHSICNYLAFRGHPYLSFFLLGAFIVFIRFINLHYTWPHLAHRPEIFDPHVYSASNMFPTLGDFCVNILCMTWFSAFVYRHRDKILRSVKNKISGYIIVVVSLTLLSLISTMLLKLFYGLVFHSSINFDVNNVLHLSRFSIVGVAMLCLSYLIFFLMAEIALTISNRLTIPFAHQIILLITVAAVSTLVASHYDSEFTIFYIIWAMVILIRGYSYRYEQGKLTLASLSMILLLASVLSAVKLNHFQSDKEKEIRINFVQQLQTPDDVTANALFKKIDGQIIADPVIRHYFTDSLHNGSYLKDYLQKKYFDGYLAKYEFKTYEFDDKGESLSSDKSFDLNVFRDMIKFESYYKESAHFYRNNGSFGVQKYSALLPVYAKDDHLGTIVIELQSKLLHGQNSFPELLIDGKSQTNDVYNDYSYAFYADGKLLSQNGKYIYSLINNEFRVGVREFLFKNTLNSEPSRFGLLNGYNHLIYRPSKRNLIVVSKEDDTIINTITSITFFFIVLLFFSVLCIISRWLWARLRIMYIKDTYLHWVFKINFDQILYKTRIQFSIVLAVAITLVLVGIITYISIIDQYNEQQENIISDKVSRISKALENSGLVYTAFSDTVSDDFKIKFDEIANTYSADLNLFNTDGVELASSQPKIYDYGLLCRRINGKAYIYLNKLQKSEYINTETIGALTYQAAYVPIKDSRRTLGYLELPYFSNESDYRTRVGSLLNAMINIYALIFIAIGLMAIIIARQITNPLNIIQLSLSKTIYGQKNEPIKWERNDEIGALITEYNNMIAALEQSAQKLAQSERESAWREMAKQVAHEIKNPLTPLKLGLQLLEKSWKDKDPKFDQKFERFSKSFVEQIESLSSIASEFSAFAKMPDTKIERIDIFEALTQAVTIFKQMEGVIIIFQPPDEPFFISADRDQLLRCFNNLLKNAIEASTPGKSCVIEISHLITSKNILLSIKDNGNGIPENLREKIFEPNFTTKSSGTGLGLAFVKNSIENAGGKVWFETSIGVGTTFYLSLPNAS